MNMSYSILWVDDQPDDIEESVGYVKNHIDSLGFVSDIMQIQYYRDNEEIVHDNKWNLIVVDYNLAQNSNGAELINSIRENKLYTEVVFYSSDYEAVEESIKTEAMEGVYWAQKNDEDLEKKVAIVIDITLKKMMDVNTMRGIVMAEVAEMDHEMTDMITLHHNNIEESEQSTLKSKIIKRCCNSEKSKIKKLEELKSSCMISDCLDFKIIDSDKRLRTISWIFNHLGICNEEQMEKLDNCRELLRKRNLLAHGKTNIESDTIKSGDQEFSLNDAIELRKEIRNQRDNFNSLHDLLN